MLKLIIAAVCFALAIVLFKFLSINDSDIITLLKIIGGSISAFMAFILILISLITPLQFKTWEKSFEIQRANYEIFSQQNNDEITLVLMTDVLAANEELAEWQGHRAAWGAWSSVPARVMDIKPIG